MTCTMLPLWTALDERDHHTALHGTRTAGIALEVGHYLDLDPRQLNHLRIAATLHDLGKIGIPDDILRKPGKLDDHEWDVMKTHSMRGVRILSARKNSLGEAADQEVIETVRHHHEHFDGCGYPDGVKGDNIPLLARILSLVDSYDAMTSARPYRVPLTHERAMMVLAEESGRRSDPRILDVFQRVIPISRYRAC